MRSSVAAAILFLVSVATAGAQTTYEAKPVELRLTTIDPSVTAVWERSTREVHDEFLRRHPEIKVIAQEGLTIHEAGGNSTGLLSIAGGISPDVMHLYYAHMHTYIEQQFVAEIDDYVAGWEREAEVPDQLWPVVTGPDGKRYGAIFTWPTLYLVYNKDIFEEVGLDPNRPPKTWDELFEYGLKLSNPDMIVETAIDPRGGFGRMGMFMQRSGSWIFPNFVWQAGGNIVKHREDGRWEAVFDSPKATEALRFYHKLRWTRWIRCDCGDEIVVDPELLEKAGSEDEDTPAAAQVRLTCPTCGKEIRLRDYVASEKVYTGMLRPGVGTGSNIRYHKAFGRGEVAMVIAPLRNLQEILDQNVLRLEAIGVAPLPAGPAGRASIVDGDVYCISSNIQNDKRKMDAAWEYIKFMTSERAQEIETKIYVESGYGRFVRNPYWLKKFGYNEYFAEISPQHLAAFDEALTYGRPEPFCPSYPAMANEMSSFISKVLRTDDFEESETELKRVAAYSNLHFFKLYPEKERRMKRRIAWILAVVVAVGVSISIFFLVKALSARVAAQRSGLSAALKASRWRHFYAWLFLFPAVSTILLWNYLPLLSGSVMSFYDYKILGGGTYIGLDNFIDAVSTRIFWTALKNTFFYTTLTMTFGFIAPIVLALFLSEVPRFKITFRLLFYLPALTSALVLMFLWKELLYSPSPAGILNRMIEGGINPAIEFFNSILLWFGASGFSTLGPQKWLDDPRLAMACVIVPGIWAGAGPGSIIYLAALKTVPDELYEASEMDGASPFQKIRHVTLPYLKALVIINFFGAFIGSFHATQNIFVMTMGGPEKATHTLSLEIFFNAFFYLKFGYATAMAWIMGSMLIGFTLYQLRIFQRVTFTAGAGRAAKA